MTNDNATLIGVLVDRSGSMEAIRDDMQGGVNTFIASQKDQPGTCELVLADFDTEYREVFSWVPLNTVDVNYTLEPRGGTALNDSVGKLVKDIGARLAARPESARPGKVIIVIVTDGYENSSREWTTKMVKDLITEQTAKWNWQFIFLGKDVDAFAQADSFGISRDSTVNFTNAPMAMASTSANVAAYRATGKADSLTYTEKQREDAEKK